MGEEVQEVDDVYEMTMQLLGATEMWSAHGQGEVPTNPLLHYY